MDKQIRELMDSYKDAIRANAERIKVPVSNGTVASKCGIAAQLLDAIKRSPVMDARQTVYMQHMVMQTLAEIERHEYDEAKWANGGLVPITSEVDRLTDFFGWHEITDMAPGEHKLLADEAEDVPFVTLKAAFNQGRTFGFGVGFHYTDREVEQQAKGMLNVVTERARIAREKIDRSLNHFIAAGQSSMGVDGMFSLKNTLVATVAKEWDGTDASPSEIITDFSNLYKRFNSVEGEPDTIVMPRLVLHHLRTTLIDTSNSSNLTLLQYLQSAYPFVKTWEWTPENEDHGQGGAPAVLWYKKDAERIRFEVPQRPTPASTEKRGTKTVVELRGRYATPIIKRPKSVMQILGVGGLPA